MDNRVDGAMVAYPLFQEEGSGSIPTSTLQLNIVEINCKDAIRLNRLWHSRLPKMSQAIGAICYGAEFKGIWFAVAIWTHPVARLLPQNKWLELRRLAISPNAPKNTPSRMISIMTRMIRKKSPHLEKLISYQDTEVHTGTIYKASGWTPIDIMKSGSDWV